MHTGSRVDVIGPNPKIPHVFLKKKHLKNNQTHQKATPYFF